MCFCFLEPLVEKDLAADEMCSRSTSIYGKQARRKPTPECSLKTVRKRKKKRKTPVVSTADSPTPGTTRCSIAEHTEDPLPQRRQDLLRGGAAQDNGDIQSRPLVTEQHLLPVKKTEKSGRVCSRNERSAPVEVVALPEEGCSVDGEKKRWMKKGHRCVRRHSLPWSSYGRRCCQRKHRPKREFQGCL